jgi:hypothetical protein
MKAKGAMPQVGQAAVSNPPHKSANNILCALLISLKSLDWLSRIKIQRSYKFAAKVRKSFGDNPLFLFIQQKSFFSPFIILGEKKNAIFAKILSDEKRIRGSRS